jgi:hypothetical protein
MNVAINSDISHPPSDAHAWVQIKSKQRRHQSYADHVDGTSVLVGGGVYEFGGNGVHRVAGVC